MGIFGIKKYEQILKFVYTKGGGPFNKLVVNTHNACNTCNSHEAVISNYVCIILNFVERYFRHKKYKHASKLCVH